MQFQFSPNTIYIWKKIKFMIKFAFEIANIFRIPKQYRKSFNEWPFPS